MKVKLCNDSVIYLTYLSGVKRSIVSNRSAFENVTPNFIQIENLDSLRDVRNVRSLCKIRYFLMVNYENATIEINRGSSLLELKCLQDKEDISALLKDKDLLNVLVRTDFTATDFIFEISKKVFEIMRNSDTIRGLFPSWLGDNYNLLVNLFGIIEEISISSVLTRFSSIKTSLPYGSYLNVPDNYEECLPSGCNFFGADNKFFETLYKLYGKKFSGMVELKQSDEKSVVTIADKIIDDLKSVSGKLLVAVDCENSNPYKFLSVMNCMLTSEYRNKIFKILLLDGAKTDALWASLSSLIDVPVSYFRVEPLLTTKSIVDMRLNSEVTYEVCKSNGEISNVALFSSDSDYWGMIESSVSTREGVKFSVFYETEYNKFSLSTSAKYVANGVRLHAIDLFYDQTVVDRMKKDAILSVVNKEFEKSALPNVTCLVNSIVASAPMYLNNSDVISYMNSVIKNLVVESNGMGELKIVCKDVDLTVERKALVVV